MKLYEIAGIITIIGILGLAVTLGINPDKDEILPESPIPQSPNMITGKYAEAICEISKIPCPENVEFEGRAVVHKDSDIVHKDYLGYNFISKKIIYIFRIIDEQLVFREQILVNGTWPAGDWMIWSFDGGEPLPAPYNIFLIKK